MLDFLQNIFILEGRTHWYPLIWLVVAGIFLHGQPRKRELVCGRIEARWFPLNAVLLALPLLLWAGLRRNIGDTFAYIMHYQNAPSSLFELLPMLNADSKDPGFSVLMTLIKMLGVSDHRIFFLIIATFQMFCMVWTFRKYSHNYWASIYLFVASTDYLSWMFNGMRQFIAATMIFAAMALLMQRRYKTYAVIVLLAAQIHGSAIVMLPLTFVMSGSFLNRKTILMIVATFMIIPFSNQIMPVLNDLLADTQYSGTMTDELWTVDDGTNPIRVLVYSMPALIALLGFRHIRAANHPVMNICANASLITMAIYLVSMVTSGVYVGRIPIYTTLHGYIALPWIIDEVFEKSTARLIYLLMISCFLLFFFYQCHFTWGFF